MGLKKIQQNINQKFEKTKEDQNSIAGQLADFQLVTKDSLSTLEENLINFNKLIVGKVEGKITIEEPMSRPPSNLSVHSKDSNESEKEGEEKVEKVHYKKTNLKEYTLEKF